MQKSLLVAALAASMLLAGCETRQDTGTLVGAVAGGLIGNQFGKGGGRVAATLAGAVVGSSRTCRTPTSARSRRAG